MRFTEVTSKEALVVLTVMLPVGVAVAGSHTVAHLEFGPVYALDAVLFASILCLIFLVDWRLAWLAMVRQKFAAWMLTTIIFASTPRLLSAEITRVALMDYAPFLYLLYALASLVVISEFSERQFFIAKKLLAWSLIVHWGVVAVYQIDLIFPPNEPSFPRFAQQLEIRPDLDGILLGVTAAYLFYSSRSRQLTYRLLSHSGSIILFFQVALLESRAALIGSALALSFAAFHLVRGSSQKNSILTTFFVILILPSSIAIPATNLLDKFQGGLYAANSVISTLGAESGPKSEGAESGPKSEGAEFDEGERNAGPTLARLRAWRSLSIWIFENPQRALIGNGFGGEHLRESGAAMELLGPEPVQTSIHPHNFFLQSAAVIGMPITLVLFVLATWSIFANRRAQEPQGALFLMSKSLAVGLVFASLAGVVWESPSGAVILSFAIGSGLAKPRPLVA